MSDIFISYASKDRSRAEMLARALEGQGWSVWWDRIIPPGKTFDEVIEQALDASSCVIVLWSQAAVASQWVRAEAGDGLKRGILIPVLIEDVQLPLAFRQIHAAGLTDWRGDSAHPGFAQLLDAVSGLLGEPTPVERQPVPDGQIREPERRSTQTGAQRERRRGLGGEARTEPSAEMPPSASGKASKWVAVAIASLALVGVASYGAFQYYEQQRRGAEESSAEANSALHETFKDCPECPEMAAVPAGSFIMGKRQVTISRPFAVGIHEVTFAEFDACVDAGACRFRFGRPGDENLSGGRRPVVKVRWSDAKRYAEWLTQETGKTYRLLTEAEWEYAARAGTSTRYWWGDKFDPERANHNGKGSTDVGTYPPNPWNLFDMHGNVWEWVEDCWQGNGHDDAPRNGGARTSDDCEWRVLRGGSWYRGEANGGVGSSSRRKGYDGGVEDFIGFRVARTLP